MLLRKLKYDDWDRVVDWRNASADCFPPRETPLTMWEHLRWYENIYMRDPADHMYIIEAEGEGGFKGRVGTIGINVTDDTIQRVIRGIPEVAPGIMSTALKTLMAIYGRPCYNLEVLAKNEHAIAFYEKNGFKRAAHGDFLCMDGVTEMASMYNHWDR